LAVRGVKPMPAVLRIVNGTHRRDKHGDIDQAKADIKSSEESFGPLIKPKGLSPEADKCWKRMITPARWLDGSKEVAAQAFCELYAEWSRGPEHFPGNKHGQMRAYMSDLGLTDSRNRGKIEKKEKDEFFDD
jgi:phage terminase small subunit